MNGPPRFEGKLTACGDPAVLDAEVAVVELCEGTEAHGSRAAAGRREACVAILKREGCAHTQHGPMACHTARRLQACWSHRRERHKSTQEPWVTGHCAVFAALPAASYPP